MSVAPKSKPERIAFFGARTGPWSTNATVLQIETTAVTALGTKVTAAQAAHAAFIEAHAAAKAATTTYNDAVEAMTIAGMQLVDRIRATGRTNGAVWALAQLPPPPTPQPTPAPGKPSDLTVELNGNGALLLKWKCKNPKGSQGVIYQLWRRIGGGGEWGYVGGVGQREYEDVTLPAGATQVTYQIQAVRSTGVGMWAEFNVNFGTNASVPPTVAESAVTSAATTATASRVAA